MANASEVLSTLAGFNSRIIDLRKSGDHFAADREEEKANAYRKQYSMALDEMRTDIRNPYLQKTGMASKLAQALPEYGEAQVRDLIKKGEIQDGYMMTDIVGETDVNSLYSNVSKMVKKDRAAFAQLRQYETLDRAQDDTLYAQKFGETVLAKAQLGFARMEAEQNAMPGAKSSSLFTSVADTVGIIGLPQKGALSAVSVNASVKQRDRLSLIPGLEVTKKIPGTEVTKKTGYTMGELYDDVASDRPLKDDVAVWARNQILQMDETHKNNFLTSPLGVALRNKLGEQLTQEVPLGGGINPTTGEPEPGVKTTFVAKSGRIVKSGFDMQDMFKQTNEYKAVNAAGRALAGITPASPSMTPKDAAQDMKFWRKQALRLKSEYVSAENAESQSRIETTFNTVLSKINELGGTSLMAPYRASMRPDKLKEFTADLVLPTVAAKSAAPSGQTPVSNNPIALSPGK